MSSHLPILKLLRVEGPTVVVMGEATLPRDTAMLVTTLHCRPRIIQRPHHLLVPHLLVAGSLFANKSTFLQLTHD